MGTWWKHSLVFLALAFRSCFMSFCLMPPKHTYSLVSTVAEVIIWINDITCWFSPDPRRLISLLLLLSFVSRTLLLSRAAGLVFLGPCERVKASSTFLSSLHFNPWVMAEMCEAQKWLSLLACGHEPSVTSLQTKTAQFLSNLPTEHTPEVCTCVTVV